MTSSHKGDTVEQFSTEHITEFITMLVEAGNAYKVDELGVIHSSKDNKELTLPIGNPPKETKLVVYRANQQDPDVIIVNPFVEGLQQTPQELSWFYTTRYFVLGHCLASIMKNIIILGIKQTTHNEEEIPADVIALISPYLDMIDDKMIKEIELVHKKYVDFLNIFWDRNTNSCVLRIGCQDKTYQDKYDKKVRQKTWNFMTKVVLDIFGTDNVKSKYFIKSTNQGFSRIECFSQVFLMVIKALKPYMILNPSFPVFDCEKFEKHVAKIPLYYTRAKFIFTPSVKQKKVDNTPPPWTPVSVMDVPTAMTNTTQTISTAPPVPPTISPMTTATSPQPIPVQQQVAQPQNQYNPMLQQPYQQMSVPQQPVGVSVGHYADMVAQSNPWGMVQQPQMPVYQYQQYPQQQMMPGYGQPQVMYAQPGYVQMQQPQMVGQYGQQPMQMPAQTMIQTSMGIPMVMGTDINSNRAPFHRG